MITLHFVYNRSTNMNYFQLSVNKVKGQLGKEYVKRKPKMHQVLIFAKRLPLHVNSTPDNSATIEPRITRMLR